MIYRAIRLVFAAINFTAAIPACAAPCDGMAQFSRETFSPAAIVSEAGV
jgi:hypothetical protein